MSLPPAIFIFGPTASGKTGLAIKLMKYYPIEIISVDSALVYKDMDIGTAKPTAEELQKAPHRLISFLDPTESYSAADFRDDALQEMAEITAKGKIPVLVGGTMLYFRALENGIAKMPQADANIREKLNADAENIGWDGLHERLLEIDPVAGERIHPNDQQRIQRALEVFEITGRTLTAYQQQGTEEKLPYRLLKIALIPEEREWIRELAALRFDQMLEVGFVDEVKSLRDRGDLHKDLPSMRCVGYRQAWQYLEGELDYEEMTERAVIATRQLAKRQMTYMRSEPNITQFGARDYDLEEVIQAIQRFLD